MWIQGLGRSCGRGPMGNPAGREQLRAVPRTSVERRSYPRAPSLEAGNIREGALGGADMCCSLEPHDEGKGVS